jgi:hypothetical protein
MILPRAAVSTESLLLAATMASFAYDLRTKAPATGRGSLPGIAFDDVELSGGVAYLVGRDQDAHRDVTDLANLK